MTRRPRLLDLFCKAGGCSVGYHRAGFDVVGIDHEPQKHYPFEFHRLDWREGLARFAGEVDVIHASPPCQAYSITNNMPNVSSAVHPDMVADVRRALEASGKLWVIENVLGAPLHCAALVCGLALGLGVKRHRYFEANIFLFGTTCPPGHKASFLTIFGNDVLERTGGKTWVTVCGGGAPAHKDGRRRATVAVARVAMGIDWMTRDELSQAIPPAYTEFIGRQLIRAIEGAS